CQLILGVRCNKKMKKFSKTNIGRPTQKDALEFIKKGSYRVGKEHYVKPKKRIEELEKLSMKISELLKKNIPRSRNLDLVILKCHLLIEFMIDQSINLFSEHKVEIQRERFSFYQKITLLHILGFPPNPTILPSIELINKIRNQVAHTLSVDRDMVDTLIKINSEDPETFQVGDDSERVKAIKTITRFICGALMGVIQAFHIEAYEQALGTEPGAGR
ncbi:hypothetical protein KA005_05375, partial [bacterium]|nr:hypothetical protein [bacterium]